MIDINGYQLELNPWIILSTLIAIGGFLLSRAGYRLSKIRDEKVESAGQLGVLYGGLNSLIEQLQRDNALFRETSERCEDRLREAKKVVEELQAHIIRLEAGD